jgi:hypothetical protein
MRVYRRAFSGEADAGQVELALRRLAEEEGNASHTYAA